MLKSVPQTEKDFADIASAGLNWVRIPLPHWAIETTASEPFLPRVSWECELPASFVSGACLGAESLPSDFLKAITWARKYGIRINLDLHTVPGSQKSARRQPISFVTSLTFRLQRLEP